VSKIDWPAAKERQTDEEDARRYAALRLMTDRPPGDQATRRSPRGPGMSRDREFFAIVEEEFTRAMESSKSVEHPEQTVPVKPVVPPPPSS
jgi:hypothetical protein